MCTLRGSEEVAQWLVKIGARQGLLLPDQITLLPALLPSAPLQFLSKGSGQAGAVSSTSSPQEGLSAGAVRERVSSIGE